MSDWIGKRYWLVGASEGLGRALAHQLSRAGVEVIVSARDAARLEEVVAELPGPASAVTIDVSDGASVAKAAAEIGPVDGMIYLAGAYWPMPATQWDTKQAEIMVEVNFTGALRVLGEVIPGMVERGAGHVVLTGSLSAFRGLPGTVGYSSSKAALASLAETLRFDLKGTGVKVQTANPGFIRTRLTEKNDFKMPFILEPEDAAQAMFDHMQTDRFKKSFPRLFSLFFRASQLMPDWLYFRMF